MVFVDVFHVDSQPHKFCIMILNNRWVCSQTAGAKKTRENGFDSTRVFRHCFLFFCRIVSYHQTKLKFANFPIADESPWSPL